MKIERNKKLAQYTTFRVGGPSDYFINAKSEEEIIHGFDFARKKKIPIVVIGNGSNIIINDRGFRGLTLKNSVDGCEVKETELECQTGLKLTSLLSIAKNNKLKGLGFLWGIPGTLGGAIVGNAGTGKKSISDYIKKIKVIEKNGNIRNFGKEYFNFRYRESNLKKSGELVLSCVLELKRGEEKISKSLADKRLNQPKGLGAGSIFKNPEKYKAGRLIERAGLKGTQIGKAAVSEEHANFIINKGGAKAEDIIKLVTLAESEVMNKFGVQLEREVRILTEKGWI